MVSPFDEEILPDEVLLLILQRVPDGKDWDRVRLVNRRFSRIAATSALPIGLIQAQYRPLLQMLWGFEGEFELNWSRAGRFWREMQAQKEVLDLLRCRSSNEVATTAVILISGISRFMKRLDVDGIIHNLGTTPDVHMLCLARIARRVLSPYSLALLRYAVLCIDRELFDQEEYAVLYDYLLTDRDRDEEKQLCLELCRLAMAEAGMLTFNDRIGNFLTAIRKHKEIYQRCTEQAVQMRKRLERQTSASERMLYFATDSILKQYLSAGQSMQSHKVKPEHMTHDQISQLSSITRTKLAVRYHQAKQMNKKISDIFEDKVLSARIVSNINLEKVGQGLALELQQIANIETRHDLMWEVKKELKLLGMHNWPACAYLQS